MAVGKAIRRARAQLGVTQEHLAEMIDVSPTYIRHLETGRRLPSMETLYSLSTRLNMSVDEIFFPQNTDTTELRSKLVRKLNDCTPHELNILYSILELIKDKKGD